MRISNLGGRPSKLTTSVALRLVTQLGRGDSYEEAAKKAGVGVATVYRWIALGRLGDRRFAELAEAVEMARFAASGAKAFGNVTLALLKMGL